MRAGCTGMLLLTGSVQFGLLSQRTRSQADRTAFAWLLPT
jgi:hypothetical protein